MFRFTFALLAGAVLALAASIASPLPAQEPENLGTIKPQATYQKSTIAVIPFNIQDLPMDAETMPRIIRNNLALSGFFRMPKDQRAANRLNRRDNSTGKIHWDEWEALGVEQYLMGQVSGKGGQLEVSVLLYDVPSRSRILSSRFRDSTERTRFMAHTISDAVIKQITGFEGVCRTKLLFVTEQIPGTKEIGIMDWDGYNARPVTDFGKIATTPAWGKGGTEMYFTSYHRNRANIYGRQLLPDAAMNLVPGQLWEIAAYGGTNHNPAWSPAAERIAMVLSKDGNSEIYTCDRSGQNLRRLTTTTYTEGSPTWSPDGSRVAFTSNDTGGVHLYVMNADGSNRRRITRVGGWNDAVSWSPDGNRLAFAHRVGGVTDIYLCDVSGAENSYRRLTMNQGNNESPTWAPDGVHLAFASDRTGQWQIYVMLDDGSGQRQITNTGRNILPDWGPIPK